MRILALSDPHLSLDTPGKAMDRFGPQWVRHAETIERNWRAVVGPDDLVLVPGDVSWAMKLPGARADLEFLGSLPGRKLLAKGNHDYWWASRTKVRAALPPGMEIVQGDAVRIGRVVLAGTRLWDTPGLSFDAMIDWCPEPRAAISAGRTVADEQESLRIFEREMGRLRNALEALVKLAGEGDVHRRIVVTHYPPTDAGLAETEATQLFERCGVHHVVFGHLHSVRAGLEPAPFGERAGVRYHLTSADFVGFRPVLIDELPDT